MYFAAALLIRPNTIATHVLTQRKPRPKRVLLTGPTLVWNHCQFSGPYFSKDKVFRCPTKMAEPIRIRAGNGGDDEGGIRAIEQEPLVNGSSSDSAFKGLEAILNNLSKWVVAVLFGLLILWRHDAEALWGATGSVINAGLSTALKRVFNQERPVANLRSDPGMPSSHAQSIFYITTYAVLSMIQWWGLNGFTTTIGGFVFIVGTYFTWLRVSQKLHTISQVAVGALLGTVFCALWFWSWGAIVLKAFVSNVWVQILVTLGGAAFCVTFVLYAIRDLKMHSRVIWEVAHKVSTRIERCKNLSISKLWLQEFKKLHFNQRDIGVVKSSLTICETQTSKNAFHNSLL
ncbi:OLC1v1010909C1 [Oldenlandia corymbosa var. corymbosa]|uniref:OLC1v1010909C1 n=1 Tax=Oldenlandia corymbosa var. corymbosa TaxID=529605 RepID=A0AAV1DVU9_OLDCO|nr:OLC1v1010909C1 [Oldenlandia corymbosa var. corymbosa]